MPLRLCWRAPRTTSSARGVRRSAGTGICRSPERNWPVSEPGCASISFGVPSATTSPPCSPAPGPRSTTWSAARIVPSSCSTTITVLPRSRSRSSVADQLLVVALVQADRGLVEDVEDADEAGADLGREPDPLRLAAGERRRAALERQVADPDRVEEPQPLADLADDQPRDRALGLGQLERLDPLQRPPRRELRVLVDVQPADGDREALRPQPRAAARRARPQRHQRLDPLARGLRVGVLVAALEAVEHALEAAPCRCACGRTGCGRRSCGGRRRCPRAAGRGRAWAGRARACRRRSRSPRRPPRAAAGGRSRPPSSTARARPRDRQRRVGDDQLRVDHPLEAEPVAALAAAVRRVEGEDPRLELGHRGAAVEAGELLAEDEHLAPLAGAGPAQHLGARSLGARRRPTPTPPNASGGGGGQARPRPAPRRAARRPRATRRAACAAPPSSPGGRRRSRCRA